MDLKTVNASDLSEILRKFFAEVKIEKGQALTPSALTGIRAAIHRHLTCADRIVATTFHTIVSCYISVKHFFLLNEFVRFGLVY